MANLNPRQRKFSELYAAGPDGIRGVARICYTAAGYVAKTTEVADAGASRLLSSVKVSEYIAELHRKADAALIQQMKDWKTMAPAAQARIFQLMFGRMPNPGNPRDPDVSMKTRDDAACVREMKECAMFIVERAYPSKRYCDVEIIDPLGTIAAVFGMTEEELVSIEGFQGYADA